MLWAKNIYIIYLLIKLDNHMLRLFPIINI